MPSRHQRASSGTRNLWIGCSSISSPAANGNGERSPLTAAGLSFRHAGSYSVVFGGIARSSSGRIRSIGAGKTIVVALAEPISSSVCR
jgi:hypothetical protein